MKVMEMDVSVAGFAGICTVKADIPEEAYEFIWGDWRHVEVTELMFCVHITYRTSSRMPYHTSTYQCPICMLAKAPLSCPGPIPRVGQFLYPFHSGRRRR